jgi:RimJ/RimL family protein N-acetyltransferase
MKNWIPHPTTLSGETVELVSLDRQHFDSLDILAKDERIWQHYVYDGTNSQKFISTLESALADRDSGTQFPFTIIQKSDGKIVGSTRFMDVQSRHRKLEIGSTWLHPDYWGSALNLECKLLLLSFSFETLGALRVQLKTDENNIRSRKAIEKIGGQFEGVLRSDMLRDNNTRRNSAYYSILEEEWQEKKKVLSRLFENKKLNR